MRAPQCMCEQCHWRHVVLDGSVLPHKRKAIIDDFNCTASKTFV